MRPLVVVPTYNEAESLPGVLERALAADPDLDVLVVDDGSPDGTGDLAEALAARTGRVHVLHRSGKAGLGVAYRAGFAWGRRHGYDTFVEMDADASHDPADLPRLLHAVRGADVAIGSRYVPGGKVVAWPRRRLLLSRFGNAYARALTGLPVADATSGFRALRGTVLDTIAVAATRSDGYAFQLETALRAWRAGFRIVEIPITFTERGAGASKMGGTIVLEALWSVPRWALTGPRGPHHVDAASVAAPRTVGSQDAS